MNSIETKIAHIELIDNSFFYIRYKKDIIVNKEQAQSLLDAFASMKSVECPRIYHYNPEISFEFDGIRVLSASKQARAIAVVYDTTISTDILENIKNNFKVLDFTSPIKFFGSREEAVDWIKQFS